MGFQGWRGPEDGPLEMRAGGLGRVLSPFVGPLVLCLGDLMRRLPFDGRSWSVPAVFAGACALVLVFLVGRELVRYRRRRRRGCLVRIDDSGITLAGSRTVGWDAIREVRDVRRSGRQGLVPIAHAGVELPLFDAVPLRDRARVAARVERFWGGPLVLIPSRLDTDATRITAAIRHFGRGVPVRKAPSGDQLLGDEVAVRVRVDERARKEGLRFGDLCELVDQGRARGIDPGAVVLGDHWRTKQLPGRAGFRGRWMEV